MFEVKVEKIKGHCPVYKIGDRITIEPPRIILDRTDALCIHALPVILHYAIAINEGIDPVKLGLTTPKESDVYYLQCLDPGPPYTKGGTVIFKCRRI
ncbi:MAG: TIGR04076 family protein [Candidatus Odinarchaeota archaeon]